MSIAPTITATVTEELDIKPALRAKYLLQLKDYAAAKAAADAATEALDAAKTAVALTHAAIGNPTSVSLDGYTVTEVRGVRKELNKEKLLAMGVTTTMLAEATENKPNKPYLKITVPHGA